MIADKCLNEKPEKSAERNNIHENTFRKETRKLPEDDNERVNKI